MPRPEFLPSPLEDMVGYFDPIDFGAILPFTGVPACNLPVYASQWPSPDITQDLVRGCELGFTAVSISGDWITRAFKAQPRTDPYERVYAYGSYEG
jgi:hypothetical protein